MFHATSLHLNCFLPLPMAKQFGFTRWISFIWIKLSMTSWLLTSHDESLGNHITIPLRKNCAVITQLWGVRWASQKGGGQNNNKIQPLRFVLKRNWQIFQSTFWLLGSILKCHREPCGLELPKSVAWFNYTRKSCETDYWYCSYRFSGMEYLSAFTLFQVGSEWETAPGLLSNVIVEIKCPGFYLPSSWSW